MTRNIVQEACDFCAQIKPKSVFTIKESQLGPIHVICSERRPGSEYLVDTWEVVYSTHFNMISDYFEFQDVETGTPIVMFVKVLTNKREIENRNNALTEQERAALRLHLSLEEAYGRLAQIHGENSKTHKALKEVMWKLREQK